MKLRLTRLARITHEAGEIVEVSPEVANFLLGVGSAVKVEEEPKKPAKEEPKKPAKKKK